MLFNQREAALCWNLDSAYGGLELLSESEGEQPREEPDERSPESVAEVQDALSEAMKLDKLTWPVHVHQSVIELAPASPLASLSVVNPQFERSDKEHCFLALETLMRGGHHR